MSKQYLIWKDRNCNGINPEWISLTGKEYFEFLHKEENKGRFFIKIPSLGDGDDTITIETTKEKHDKAEADRKEEARKLEYKKKFVTFSFDVTDEANDLMIYELLGNMQDDLEETMEKTILLEKLPKALESLTDKEREIIDLYYFTDGATEQSVAKKLGIPQQTLNSRKLAILKKLKNFFG